MFKHNVLLWIQILSIESFGSKKIVSQKVLQEFQNASRGLLRNQNNQNSCFKYKFLKKSLASKLKGLLKSFALNPGQEKPCFEKPIYWKSVGTFWIWTPTYVHVAKRFQKMENWKRGNKNKIYQNCNGTSMVLTPLFRGFTHKKQNKYMYMYLNLSNPMK